MKTTLVKFDNTNNSTIEYIGYYNMLDNVEVLCHSSIRINKEKTILEDYIEGLNTLKVLYNDQEYLSFIDDLQASNYIIAFSKSALLANLRKAEHILETKNDIDRYFTNK